MADAADEPVRAADPLHAWRDDLSAWAIPTDLLASVTDSPWTLPKSVFSRRTRRGLGQPSGVSYELAAEALGAGGSVLDVGCGTGAASLPLRPAGGVVGVDESPTMLAGFESFAAAEGIGCEATAGRWPDVAPQVRPADVVVCHHVLYNVPDLGPFVTQLTAHARRRVVVEITALHPTSNLNPLWERLHGLSRPRRPTAADAIEAIRTLGIDVRHRSWHRPASADFGSYDEMLDVTGKRLCLSPSRRDELDAALRDLGVSPDSPRLGPAERDVVTIWWAGSATDRDAGSAAPIGA